MYEDLAKAREGFVLASDLHLLYEVTPTYVDIEPDWGVYYSRFMELSHTDQVRKSSSKLCSSLSTTSTGDLVIICLTFITFEPFE